MKQVTPNEKGRASVTLRPGETLWVCPARHTPLAIHEDGFYKLSDPVDEVIAGHILKDTVPAHWCSVEQRWVT